MTLRFARAAVIVGLAACNTPTPLLRLELSAKDSQTCPSTECKDLPMACDTVMSIRVIDLQNGTTPIDQCVKVQYDHGHTMCSLASIDLDATLLPVRELEVQVAVYPASMIPKDPSKPQGLACPTNIQYSSATDFPVEQSPTPALGGRAFYHPGDQTVVVTLGCTDLAAISESCAMPNQRTVTATVEDFETLLSVPGGSVDADQLFVSVGEPKSVDGSFVLTGLDLHRLMPQDNPGNSAAAWSDDVDLPLEKYACIDVFESVHESTATLRCSPVTDGTLELLGARMSKDTLQLLLNALSPMAPLPFPSGGFTVGVVADQSANLVSGITVTGNTTTGTATVQYLTGKNELVRDPALSTGVFVSTDAPFGTTFETSGGGRPQISGIGGKVKGRVTVVVLQYRGLSL